MISLIGLALAIAGGIVLGRALSQPSGLRRLGLWTVRVLTHVLGLVSTIMMCGLVFYTGHPIIGWSLLVGWLTMEVLMGGLCFYGRYIRRPPVSFLEPTPPPCRQIGRLIIATLSVVFWIDVWITNTLLPAIGPNYFQNISAGAWLGIAVAAGLMGLGVAVAFIARRANGPTLVSSPPPVEPPGSTPWWCPKCGLRHVLSPEIIQLRAERELAGPLGFVPTFLCRSCDADRLDATWDVPPASTPTAAAGFPVEP